MSTIIVNYRCGYCGLKYDNKSYHLHNHCTKKPGRSFDRDTLSPLELAYLERDEARVKIKEMEKKVTDALCAHKGIAGQKEKLHQQMGRVYRERNAARSRVAELETILEQSDKEVERLERALAEAKWRFEDLEIKDPDGENLTGDFLYNSHDDLPAYQPDIFEQCCNEDIWEVEPPRIARHKFIRVRRNAVVASTFFTLVGLVVLLTTIGVLCL